MLHAVEKNKTGYFKRYFGHRDGEEVNVREEDEITSTVLGPLEFLPVASSFRFWQTVFELCGLRVAPEPEFPSSVSVALWPRNHVEPDAHFTYNWPDGRRLDILIEIKWHAPLSGNDQLQCQWLEYLDDDARRNCWHFFIAPEISAGLVARDSEEGKIWNLGGESRLVLMSWARFRDALSNCRNGADGFARWAVLASNFLERIGVRRFDGFSEAHQRCPSAAIQHQQFFGGLNHGFKGFAHIASPPSISAATNRPFFKG